MAETALVPYVLLNDGQLEQLKKAVGALHFLKDWIGTIVNAANEKDLIGQLLALAEEKWTTEISKEICIVKDRTQLWNSTEPHNYKNSDAWRIQELNFSRPLMCFLSVKCGEMTAQMSRTFILPNNTNEIKDQYQNLQDDHEEFLMRFLYSGNYTHSVIRGYKAALKRKYGENAPEVSSCGNLIGTSKNVPKGELRATGKSNQILRNLVYATNVVHGFKDPFHGGRQTYVCYGNPYIIQSTAIPVGLATLENIQKEKTSVQGPSTRRAYKASPAHKEEDAGSFFEKSNGNESEGANAEKEDESGSEESEVGSSDEEEDTVDRQVRDDLETGFLEDEDEEDSDED